MLWPRWLARLEEAAKTVIPLSQKALVDKFRPIAEGRHVRALTASDAKRVAVFAIHGISPIQRYAFQDQVALALQSYLNASEPADSTVNWKSIVHWPNVAADGGDSGVAVRPSALRLYQSNDDPNQPQHRVYDVYEGYWSPLSKGKANVASAAKWLLNATFLGNSSTANVPCSLGKLAFDLFYVATLLVAASFVCAFAFWCGYEAWQALVASLAVKLDVNFVDLVQNPFQTLFKFPRLVYVECLLYLTIGYIAAQIVTALNAARKRQGRRRTLSRDVTKSGHFESATIEAHKFHLTTFAVLLAVLGASVWLAWFLGGRSDFTTDWIYVAGIVGFAVFLQAARSIADFAVENVLGDVEVYTTHDANSSYYKVRGEIIATVTSALKGVLNAVAEPGVPEEQPASRQEPYYGAVHILGHSLGSTIGMDALILLRQLIEEGSPADRQWKRIRSFTTFGTALEKTRFFFDVRQPSLNAAQDQWGNDVYGGFFTKELTALNGSTNAEGIYWSNHWYFRDVVSNAIVSYKSDCNVGSFQFKSASRAICENYQIPHRRFLFAWVHSDYLADPSFWQHVGPVVTG